MIKVLIADDHQIVLDGLVSLLVNEKSIKVVDTALNGIDALEILKNNVIDIAILDIEMPQKTGIQVAEVIQTTYPETKTLILTMHNERSYIKRLIEIGASGYVLKNRGKEDLVEAIVDIYNGKSFYGREVTEQLIYGIKEEASKSSLEPVTLTKREKEVLSLIGDGLSTPQIAEKLFIAHSTVETHRRNLLDKTGVPTSKSLIKWAIKNGYSD